MALAGRLEAQTLARAVVEFRRDGITVGLGEYRHVAALGQVLSQQPVGVLVGAPFPGMVGPREVEAGACGPLPRLAVFDLDGTLTDTNAVDDECYRRTAAAQLGLEATAIDWSRAPAVTDSAIAEWLFTTYRGIAASDHDIISFLDHFIDELHRAHRQAPERFRAIPGAVGLFAHLRAAGWHVAIATGGWEPSARFKLAVAGLADPSVPLASATNASRRVAIMALARHRAESEYGVAFDCVVAVGDAPWDADAAAELGWPLVAVGSRLNHLAGVPGASRLADFAERAAVDHAFGAAALAGRRLAP